MHQKSIRGLGCPSCGGAIEISEGATFLNCQYCNAGLFVKGDNGINRFFVSRKQSREDAIAQARKWFSGLDKAPDLKKRANFSDALLVYIPFWHVKAKVLGWVLGEKAKGSGKNKSYVPAETRVFRDFEFNCPACDMGEFGIRFAALSGNEVLPFDLETVQQEGMTFGVLIPPDDIVNSCETRFLKWGEAAASIDRVKFSKLYLLNKKLSLIFYPFWILRYEYNNRLYQITVDAATGDIIYGRAPGNSLYRIFFLLGSTAAGNFILTSMIRSAIGGGDSDGLLAGLAACAFIIWFGFKKFRYGGEVKKEQKSFAGEDIIKTFIPKFEGIQANTLQGLLQEIIKRSQK